MNRIATSRPARVGASIVGVAAALSLAGCAGAADGTAPAGSSAGTEAAYADGTYTAEGSYRTPETVEQISVTLTVASGTVAAVEVTGDPQRPESEQYQEKFIGGIAAEVVGKSLDDIRVDRVAGSSLTSGGFNEAVGKIRTEAAG